jgi:hypothetical protein
MSSQVRYLLPELAAEIDAAYAAIFQLLPSGYSLQLEIIEVRHCVGKNGYNTRKLGTTSLLLSRLARYPIGLKMLFAAVSKM